MKRHFCDCCGNEFEYNDEHAKVNGSALRVHLPMPDKTLLSGRATALEATLLIRFDFENVANGRHIDVCRNCRLSAIAQKLGVGILRTGTGIPDTHGGN